MDNQQGGYATNFGASLGGAGSRGIEGQLVACVFKALVSRFVKANKELKTPENMVRNIFSVARQFMINVNMVFCLYCIVYH